MRLHAPGGQFPGHADGSAAPPAPAACLKDLQRFLRRDDPDAREAFYALGEMELAKTSLLPLLVAYAEEQEVVYNSRERHQGALAGLCSSVHPQWQQRWRMVPCSWVQLTAAGLPSEAGRMLVQRCSDACPLAHASRKPACPRSQGADLPDHAAGCQKPRQAPTGSPTGLPSS